MFHVGVIHVGVLFIDKKTIVIKIFNFVSTASRELSAAEVGDYLTLRNVAEN